MIYSEFNKEEGILEVNYKGNITLEDLLEHGTFITSDSSLPRDLKILTDARGANYQFGLDKMNTLIEALRNNLKYYNSIKNAFVYSSPVETAYSVYLGSNKKLEKYYHAVFSSVEEAKSWLLGTKL